MMRAVPRPHRAALVLLLAAIACRRDPAEDPSSTPPIEPPAIAAPEEPPLDEPEPVAVRAREPGTIFVDELDRAMERGPAWLLRQLAPEPHRSGGRFAGWTITARFPDDPELAAACDVLVGDIILTVEGDTLATPTAYATLFERAHELQTLRVARIRDGRREEKVYRIVAAPLPDGAAGR